MKTEPFNSAYILHARPYRDTSVILELLTREHGRCSAVAKGARSEKSKYRGKLEPFAPLLVQLHGRSELKTLGKTDFPKRAYRLLGEPLLLGMYINELLYRLLEKFYPLEAVFDAYEALIASLEVNDDCMTAVRLFELNLLVELGYGISFDYDARNGQPVSVDYRYRFVVNEGFTETDKTDDDAFLGAELLTLAAGRLDDVNERRLRNLTRKCLGELLGDKPLKSRALFKSYAR